MLKQQSFFSSDNMVVLNNEFNKPKITAKPKQPINLISKRLKLS